MGLFGFIRSKDNSGVASKIAESSFVPTAEAFHFCELYINLALLTSSFFFLINLRILLFNESDYFFIKILYFSYIIIKQNSYINIINFKLIIKYFNLFS